MRATPQGLWRFGWIWGGVLRSAGLGGKHPKLCGSIGGTGDVKVLVLDGDQVRPALPAKPPSAEQAPRACIQL
ncbi:hypothetical protein [Streptomyces microflavus]|uniref:hypothetical protein n=1 Tax=Streptomyces microflavus TaxID=1919 RepID=UPI00381604C7